MRRTLWTLVVAALAGTGIWYYWQIKEELMSKSSEISRLEYQMEHEQTRSLARKDSFMFELIMEPFGWTIRNELLSDNLDQIHQYLSQYVKHTSIELIAVIDDQGTIISATDKKIEKRKFTNVFPGHELDKTELTIDRKENRLYIAQPLMGFDRPIGSIFLVFIPDGTIL